MYIIFLRYPYWNYVHYKLNFTFHWCALPELGTTLNMVYTYLPIKKQINRHIAFVLSIKIQKNERPQPHAAFFLLLWPLCFLSFILITIYTNDFLLKNDSVFYSYTNICTWTLFVFRIVNWYFCLSFWTLSIIFV